jgi:hypothetical protein
MIGYRFLTPAGEEMTEASVFYEAASLAWVLAFLMRYNVSSTFCATIQN